MTLLVPLYLICETWFPSQTYKFFLSAHFGVVDIHLKLFRNIITLDDNDTHDGDDYEVSKDVQFVYDDDGSEASNEHRSMCRIHIYIGMLLI